MRVKFDFDTTTCDLVEVDLVELTVMHDALAHLLETMYPHVAEALSEGESLDDAVEGMDETDAFRIRIIVERLYDKLERPLSLLEDETVLQEAEGSQRVRIVLESAEEAAALHGAAKSLSEQVGRALDASELPYPDVEGLLRDFASWFDPDDIPEYPYFIEMDVSDARIVAQLAERAYAHGQDPKLEQLVKVMQAAATSHDEDEDDDEEGDDEGEA